MSAETRFVEIEHLRPARRWLYRLPSPIRYSRSVFTSYADGTETTEHVVVSWGRDGDTCIFPADTEGRLLDTLGFNGRMGWDEPEGRLIAWLDGDVEGLGCGLSYAEVRA